MAGSDIFSRYFSKMKGSGRTAPLARPKPADIVVTVCGFFLGITLIVCLFDKDNLLAAASFGASSVLVFGVPDAAMAQPRNVIFGNIFSAVAGVITVYLFGFNWWSPAVGTALAMLIMLLTGTTHPPGGAVALSAIMHEASIRYIFMPIAAGAIILVLVGMLVNNLSPHRQYPKYWF